MICPRCGAPTSPSDKFCAICASPIGPGAGAPPPPPPPGFGPPPAPPGYGPPPDPRGGFGPPPPAPPGYGPPPGFGPPPPAPPPPGPSGGFQPPEPYGAPPPYGSPPPYGGPPEPPRYDQGGYGSPPGGYSPSPGAYGPPGGGSGGYPAPPPPQQYGSPGGYGAPPPAQGAAQCVKGHPIPPGGSYCLEGHPLALEGMQMGSDNDDGDLGATAFAPAGQMPPNAHMQGFPGEPPPPPPPPAQNHPLPPPASGMPRVATQMPGSGGGQNAGPAPSSAAGNRPLSGFLVSYQDDPMGKFWPLYQGRNVIGRAETGQEVDVPIGHGTTSTRHAQIDCDGARFTVSDLGSTNGTFHNEEAIGFQGRRDLRDGDKVRFGGFTVIVFNAAARV